VAAHLRVLASVNNVARIRRAASLRLGYPALEKELNYSLALREDNINHLFLCRTRRKKRLQRRKKKKTLKAV
jgi:hypothetical protein